MAGARTYVTGRDCPVDVLQIALCTSPGLLGFFNWFLRQWVCCSSANADMLIFRFMRRVEAAGQRRAPHRRPSAHSSGAGAGPLTLIAATHGLDEFHSPQTCGTAARRAGSGVGAWVPL